jgi:hypothetical protein
MTSREALTINPIDEWEWTRYFTPRQRALYKWTCYKCGAPIKSLHFEWHTRSYPRPVCNELSTSCPFCNIVKRSFEHFVGGDSSLYTWDVGSNSRRSEDLCLQLCFKQNEGLSPQPRHVHVQLYTPYENEGQWITRCVHTRLLGHRARQI